MAERMTVNHDVTGSSPGRGARKKDGYESDRLFFNDVFHKRNVMYPSEVKCASRVKCASGTR